jgi:predicted TIM-barrel fold metal-dependent hydrolase
VIIDFHTHIFPPDVRDNRGEYVRRDPTFAEMYGDPKAKIATAEDLRRSMEASGVDVSVALGFGWQSHEDVVRHNRYLLDIATRSDGAIIPFATINMADARAAAEIERCAAGGVRGIGELRPDNQGWDLLGAAGERLAALARAHGLLLLFHVTEPGGRGYPGRHGCAMDRFAEFARRNPDIRMIGAHLGGALHTHDGAAPDVYADTAAQPFLYRGDESEQIMRAVPPGRLLFGSDYPLISQQRQIDEIARVFPDDSERDAVLGGNAARLLGLGA